jgi:hypothetical protein
VFSIERFLSNWNRSNELGYQALSNAGEASKVQTRASAELEAIWRWNYELPRIQGELGDNVFVPRVVWLNVEEVLHSAVIWGDDIATLIPAVEKIVIGEVLGEGERQDHREWTRRDAKKDRATADERRFTQIRMGREKCGW